MDYLEVDKSLALWYPNLKYMSTKKCSKKTCKVKNPQSLENFHKNVATKDGLSYICKTCKNSYEDDYRKNNTDAIKLKAKAFRRKNPGAHEEWRKKNPEKFAANQKRYKDKNREEIRKKGLEYYYKNADKQKETSKKYREVNADKEKTRCRNYRQKNPGKINAKTARRRAAKLQATPKWTTIEHEKEIQRLYIEAARLTRETGISHHVDHIIPLQGKEVCGLHVPWNLRIIPGSENESKNNKVKEEDLESHKKFVMDSFNNKKPSNE